MVSGNGHIFRGEYKAMFRHAISTSSNHSNIAPWRRNKRKD